MSRSRDHATPKAVIAGLEKVNLSHRHAGRLTHQSHSLISEVLRGVKASQPCLDRLARLIARRLKRKGKEQSR